FVGLGVVHVWGVRSSACPGGSGCVWGGGWGSGGAGAASGAVPATASRRRRRATSTPTAAIRLTRPRYHGTVALSTASTSSVGDDRALTPTSTARPLLRRCTSMAL